MNTARLLEPVLDGGIESIKFFNGRLLTAEDLQREQLAQREVRALFGNAIGDGVVHGLRVQIARATTDPALAIEAGLAFNREGDPVHLPQDIVLELADTSLTGSTNDTPSSAAQFHQCDPPVTGLYVVGNDVWILTAYPARGTRGRAPVTGIGNSTNSCNAKYIVDGVRFRLVQVTGEFAREALTDSAAPQLRSVVAARCFDAQHALSEAIDPFAAPARDRLVEKLVQRGVIEPCEVPLAVFHWRAGVGFRFVDRWAVRRRLSARSDNRWGLSDGARAESEALVQQFQEQLDELYVHNPESVRARDHFTYLPPVGILPISGNPRRRGFTLKNFFTGFKTRPEVAVIPDAPPAYAAYTVIEASRVRPLLEEALRYTPLETSSDEVIWIYQVRENIQATRTPNSNVQPYVIFARGSVAYHGHANWDVSHWGYSTFT